MNENIILNAEKYVKKLFLNEFSGHDFWHTFRVFKMATKIAKMEKANIFIVKLSSLLHDVDDIKLSPQTHKNKDNAVKFMKEQNLNEDIILKVISIINEISFNGEHKTPSSIEGKCVQDADRLDAIGAIGIARAFAYGGNHNREIYNPNIEFNTEVTKENYRNKNSTTINHFYEKLFKLKDFMNTKTAKEIAINRDKVMKNFIEEFMLEWNIEK